MAEIKFSYDITNTVIYHGGCSDGMGAAWCFHKKFADRKQELKQEQGQKIINYYGAKYDGEIVPDDLVINKYVVFCDFVYTADVMKEIIKKAKWVTVLDHHKTAQQTYKVLNEMSEVNNFRFLLDMDRSGAQITWDELNVVDGKSVERPWFINDIGDRDLWTWKIDGSKSVTRALFGMGKYQTFETFDSINQLSRDQYKMIGDAMLSDDETHLNAICNRAVKCQAKVTTGKYPIMQYSWTVYLVECEHMYASEVGNRLVEREKTKDCDFAVMFRYDILTNTFNCSARASRTSPIDLSVIVKLFDKLAGGHPKAAGFTVDSLKNYFTPMEIHDTPPDE